MYDTALSRFTSHCIYKENSARDPDFSASQSYLRQNAACCIFPSDTNMLLIAGGVSTHQVLILTYNPYLNSFTIKRAMSTLRTQRSNHRVVACQGYFYAIGGSTMSHEDLRTCEKIAYAGVDKLGQWNQNVAQMNAGRKNFAALVVSSESRILVIGNGTTLQ